MSRRVPGAAVVRDHPGKLLDSVEPATASETAPETVLIEAEELNIKSIYDAFPDTAPGHDLSAAGRASALASDACETRPFGWVLCGQARHGFPMLGQPLSCGDASQYYRMPKLSLYFAGTARRVVARAVDRSWCITRVSGRMTTAGRVRAHSAANA
ncbi:hypothetical protein GGH96_006342 [Coemansia sp. RSA 1972]|nr:hypothetical protein GGH96_006342 [Coemansia sp. RSA 1972]